jgi:syndecan 4
MTPAKEVTLNTCMSQSLLPAPPDILEETPSPTEVVETPSLTELSTEPPKEPRLGELTVTDATPNSLSLTWTVPEGQFDHFLIQHKNGDGQPKVVRVPGHEDQVTISGLEPGHKYKMNLYGFHSGQRMGPVSAIGMTGEWTVGDPGWDLVERGPS